MSKARKLFDLVFTNETQKQKKVEMKFSKPEEFLENLNDKKMRVVKFTTNNTYIPQMIPDRVTDVNFFTNLDVGSTNIPTVYGDSFTANSLKYFIIIREKTNLNASLHFIQHTPEKSNTSSNSVAPFGPVLDDATYYQNQYYYYHDITHFFSILENEINTHYPASDFRITSNTTQSFSFYFAKAFLAIADVEFSAGLIQLFPLAHELSQYTTGVEKSYRLRTNKFETYSGSATLVRLSCPVYEKIFPFTELLFNSDDIDVNPTDFLSDADFTTNGNRGVPQNTILAFNIRTNQFLSIYDYYTYTNLNDSLWNNFLLNSSTNKNITLKIYLRLRNNVVIPFYLNPKELFNVTIELKMD
jgi:hypothetical protein